jgi:hypothetical protein
MKTWFVFPDYWENFANTPAEAQPFPWNHTSGCRVMEVGHCHYCQKLFPLAWLKQSKCESCYYDNQN